MAVSNLITAASGKTRYVVNLLSGTSWTVPAGVTYVNATLCGGGGSGGSTNTTLAQPGMGGQIVSTSFSTTPGASIAYAIGAGGSFLGGNQGGTPGNAGGNTTMTGATTANGGAGGCSSNTDGASGTNYLSALNGGGAPGLNSRSSGAGGAGSILIEYWA